MESIIQFFLKAISCISPVENHIKEISHLDLSDFFTYLH